MTLSRTSRHPALDAFAANFSDNALGPVRTLGRTFRLSIVATLQMALDLVRGQLKVREAVVMAWYLVSVTALPAFLMAIPFGVIVTIQIGNIINQLGAQSLLGAASGFAVIQQAAPLAAGILLGGAGASAIAADLGARTVREEIDAMRTMGVDPIQRLVVPRVIAAAVVAPLLAIFIVVVGVIAAFYLAVTMQGVGPGSYWQSFGSFASQRDMALALIKASIFGVIIAVIGCQRGLEAKGGPRGVADGVNATVVVSTVAIIGVNFVITLIYTVFFPLQIG
ncbi:ABC transporter permease [Gordonia sp. HNM0687]|uniref:ABC transporter permease n=1 Tax=Gordonia mangrovi TaxID=2665643 RepID=A0A6L7GKX0_9ACTN|nr:ABC transporter permease [Gordonia mangrovi]MXP20540.1 ABC transporter permease [Gordonia mangrovi]UVF78869.1 ABC transporter permease [Gordonia mangrovi]